MPEGFSETLVTLEETDGTITRGRLRVENTGAGVNYPATHSDTDGHEKSSFICTSMSIQMFRP